MVNVFKEGNVSHWLIHLAGLHLCIWSYWKVDLLNYASLIIPDKESFTILFLLIQVSNVDALEFLALDWVLMCQILGLKRLDHKSVLEVEDDAFFKLSLLFGVLDLGKIEGFDLGGWEVRLRNSPSERLELILSFEALV